MLRFILALVAVVCLSPSALHGAVIVEEAEHSLSASAGVGGLPVDLEHVAGPGTEGLAGASIVDQSIARAEARGTPFPIVMVSVEIKGTPGPGGIDASASADLTYSFIIEPELSAPLNVLGFVPVSWQYSLSGNAVNVHDDLATAGGQASMSITKVPTLGPSELVLLDSIQVLTGAEISKDETVPIQVVPDVMHDVRLLASARLLNGFPHPHDASSKITMVADPLISFDQATFDELAGDDTFPLADFYSFRFSPGVGNVPEPTSATLAALALVALIAYGHRRRGA